jgi:hypothetical protein
MKHRIGAGLLRDVLPEADRVLSWFRRGADRGGLDNAMEDFASGFLGAGPARWGFDPNGALRLVASLTSQAPG